MLLLWIWCNKTLSMTLCLGHCTQFWMEQESPKCWQCIVLFTDYFSSWYCRCWIVCVFDDDQEATRLWADNLPFNDRQITVVVSFDPPTHLCVRWCCGVCLATASETKYKLFPSTGISLMWYLWLQLSIDITFMSFWWRKGKLYYKSWEISHFCLYFGLYLCQ